MAVRVMRAMRDAGVDAFIANTTTELAMCNLVGIPTVPPPPAWAPLPNMTTIGVSLSFANLVQIALPKP